MKKLNFLFLALLAVSFLTFTSCEDEGDDPIPTPEPKDIVETAMATDDLSILVDAVVQADLVATLQSDGPFTVFAPTNDAFQALLDSNPDWNSLADIDNETLANVLKFHVIAADVKSTDLTDSYVTTLGSGPNDEQIVLQIDVTGGVKFNGSAVPTTVDVETTNGTVHIIDEVMLPPSVVNLALNNPAFSTLVAALTRSDLTTDYVSILSGEGPFTVFAPTNDAFQALLDSNPDWNSLDDIPVATLEAVLNYHVVSGANVQSKELVDDQEVAALGGMLKIDLTSTPKVETTSNQSVDIILTDVQGINGVVHVIDQILLP
ncbi:MAG: fasciclin domain-containing protein [Bacteroidetes bacterium]|nr:MAG: fasciclin domain-containing protein [Bacteroidota bacterium]